MNSSVSSPSILPGGVACDFAPISEKDFGRIPDGLVEWTMGIEKLDRAWHGFALEDIRWVEAYWHHAEIGFSSAGFVIGASGARRFYFQCAIDADNQPDIVAVSVEVLPEGTELPDFQNSCEPLGGWRKDVATFNSDIMRLRAANAA